MILKPLGTVNGRMLRCQILSFTLVFNSYLVSQILMTPAKERKKGQDFTLAMQMDRETRKTEI